MVRTTQLLIVGVAVSFLAACSANSGPCTWAGGPVCKMKKAEAPPPPPPPPAPKKMAAIPDPCAGNITLPNVNFESNSAAVRPSSAVTLDTVAEALRRCPKRQIRIEAHADSAGADAYNMQLSERRAASVRQYLIDRGASGASLSSKGFGESNPIADNSTKEGRAKNRRVEMNQM